MDIEIMPGPLSGVVRAIPSKSQAHRALICAALADKPTSIGCEGTSNDIEATAACLTALGADIKSIPDGYIVKPCGPGYKTNISEDESEQNRQKPVLRCGESGSTFRFLLPVAGALGKDVSFVLEGRLSERPLSPLYEELIRHGCFLSPHGSNPFNIEGQLNPGSYTIDAGISSQFISGLLFALPLLGSDSEIRMTGSIESFPYIELTLVMLEKFGIRVELKDMTFSVPGNQKYRSPGTIGIEGDWSNAAFWLAAGTLGGSGITCTNLDLLSRQGDRAILDVLKEFGASVKQSSSSVTVSGGKLCGIKIDARDIPDLVPILSVVAAAAEGVTEIRNAGRLRGKESDRLAAMSAVLGGLGADIKETDDGLFITGGKVLTGGTVSSRGDHRIAMSAAVAAVLCTNPVIISGAEAVNKSYPGFFDERRKLCHHNMEKN